MYRKSGRHRFIGLRLGAPELYEVYKELSGCDRFGDSESECCFLKLGPVALRQGPAPSRVPSLQEPEMCRVTINDGVEIAADKYSPE